MEKRCFICRAWYTRRGHGGRMHGRGRSCLFPGGAAARSSPSVVDGVGGLLFLGAAAVPPPPGGRWGG
eukprot:4572661-Prorocentrum_lima.AAC.1